MALGTTPTTSAISAGGGGEYDKAAACSTIDDPPKQRIDRAIRRAAEPGRDDWALVPNRCRTGMKAGVLAVLRISPRLEVLRV